MKSIALGCCCCSARNTKRRCKFSNKPRELANRVPLRTFYAQTFRLPATISATYTYDAATVIVIMDRVVRFRVIAAVE